MIYAGSFLLIWVFATSAWAQMPPGDPYDPAKHANPVVTFVEADAFKPSNYQDARDAADLEFILGLSQREGRRVSVELAEVGRLRLEVFRRRVDVFFNSVVRQTFDLTESGQLVLYSFRTPRSTSLPPGFTEAIYREAVEQHDRRDPDERRFGTANAPEPMRIRRSDALLFDEDGKLTMVWEEEGSMHVASSTVDRDTFFRLIEDLL